MNASKKILVFKIFLLILPAVIFLLFKLQNLSIRLSDTNIYFYIASEIIRGKILYKDIFFINPPFYPLISVIYFYLVRGNLLHYYFLGAIEAVICYIFIYFILWSQKRNFVVSYFSALLYLFSYIILVTSDGETGIFTATIFILLAYLFTFVRKKYFMGGIFLGLCVATKGYFFPIACAFAISQVFFRNFRAVKLLIVGSICTFALVLLPFVILAGKQMSRDLFIISSTKSQVNFGDSKVAIVQAFLSNEFLLIIILLFHLFYWKKDYFISCAVLFFILFFIFYKSFYPLYFAMIIPFLCLCAFDMIYLVRSRLSNHELIFSLIIFLYGVYTSVTYLTGFSQLGVVPNVNKMANLIKDQKPNYLFGSVELVPALAYMTNIPLLGGIIDTNNYLFESKILNKEQLTQDAINNHAIVISKGVSYPEKLMIEPLDVSIFDTDKILSSCKIIGNYEVEGGGFVNRIYLFKC